MFQQMEEPENAEANSVTISVGSEMDVSISRGSGGGGGGSAAPVTARGNCSGATGAAGDRASTCGTRLVQAMCKRVTATPKTTAGKLLRKSAAGAKYQRFPFTIIHVLLCGMILLIVILCCIIIETWSSAFKPTHSHFEPIKLSAEDRRYHEQIVHDVNTNPNSKWKAEFNKFASRAIDPQIMDKESLRIAMTKNIETHEWSKSQMLADTESHLRHLIGLRNFTLPKKFDARFRWPECRSVHQVVNQGACGSCWAMAATSVMSDRICINSEGSQQPHISAQDLIECCPHCGGCRGTVWALFSFVYWKKHGIVTGSEYGSYKGCKPYSKSPSCGSPCSIDMSINATARDVCRMTCQDLYNKPYAADLHRASSAYWVKPNVLNNVIYVKTMRKLGETIMQNNDYETLIKRELMLNGPLIACFVVYDEFQHYKSGIYEPQTSPNAHELYGHCAKLIGWGEDERDDRFWTYMNTWGHLWGENGFFRVAMKHVPEEAAAGIPLLL